MMLQWDACKKSAPDAILLFRLGDFYEAFYEDAVLLSKELDLTLTKRQEVPMSGVPHHTAEAYIDKLVGKGYRVAIAEQMEDPREVKGIVKREVVRIVTPGTVINSSLLSDKSNNFLVSLTQLNSVFGLAVLDLTTAEFRAMELEDAREVLDELSRLRPAEVLVSEKCSKHFAELQELISCSVKVKEEWQFDHRVSFERLIKHFQVLTLDGFGLKGMVAAINAAGALIGYVQEDLNLSIGHIKSIQTERLSAYMALSNTAQRHLELTESLQEGKRTHTLLYLLDHTSTPMGGRLLKQWLNHPLLSVEKICQRQAAIGEFLSQPEFSRQLALYLGHIRDLERLIMRIESGYATPRDLVALRFSLEYIPAISTLLQYFSAELISETLPDMSEIVHLIKSALVEAPPLRLSEGGIFKEGYHAELDELRTLKSNSHAWIANYQTELRESSGIKTLKVGYTKAFGYYIEVSRGQSGNVPDYFQRRQTLVNGERFITPELKEYEHKVLFAEEKMGILENELFKQLREKISAEAQAIRHIAQSIARIDCLLSLATVAALYRYVRPTVDESDRIVIDGGRHPVIEALLVGESFIPNDVLLDNKENRLLLITGPNMAGKSTYIRQTALLVILAQIGSFIPAKSAHIGIVDKVFTRIGASDDLSRGQSTFMVEMAETANILHNATSRSLVILDEIGRGTSTYDGISIAWAVAEYLLSSKSAKTLFATHYWELTQMEGQIPGALNYTVAVHESERGIVFLRKIIRGGTDKSYGIHVAKLAGLPAPVIKRAQEMLTKLEKNAPRSPSSPKQKQLDLWGS